MGLFGGETIYVDSVIYNMAGDLVDRPDYLKTTVASNVIGNSRFGMSEALNSSYLHGPGIKIRSFHRWCKQPGNYDEVGVPYSRVADESDLTPYAMASEITSAMSIVAPYYVSVSTTYYGAFDYNRFAQAYMVQYHYSIYGEAWTSAYNATTNQITITRAAPYTATTYVFTPAGYNPATDGDAMFLYSFYNVYEDASPDVWQYTRKYIYKIGSGNAVLDELVSITTDESDEFLAIIPLRFKGEFISGTYKPDVYAQTKKAYKKLTGGQKLTKLIEQLEENEDIDDIDHAFIMQGVAVNSQEQKSLKYIAHFFERMTGIDTTSWAAYTTMQALMADYQADMVAWRESRATWNDEHPGVPFPPPPVMPPVITPTRSITMSSKIGTDNTDLCDITIKWKAVTKFTGSGLGKVGAQLQEVWWNEVTTNSIDDEVVTLFWQHAADEYTGYIVKGLHFINEIYKGEAFKIGIGDALEPDEEYTESPFIIPLHYDTLKSMSLVDSTQVVLSSSYLVFNCYEVVKQKWYETTIFKIFVFVAIIAITVATGGAGAVGLLGTAGGVGASLGFTGLMATIVGAVANALAAMILLKVISVFSIAVFGAKFGAIIAAVASVIAMSFGTAMMNGASMAQAWGNMMSATNLLQLTNAVGGGVSAYLRASTMEWAQKTADLMEDYKEESNAITRQYVEEFGLGTFAFDPNQLTNNNPDGLTEPPQMFLDRTLMTGSDIAELSMDMITNFASMTLAPPTMGS